MKIAFLVLLVIVAVVFLTISIILLVRGIILASEPYRIAIEEIEGNPQVIQAVGRIEGYGFMPSGSLSIRNGYGYAYWRIKVIGYADTDYVYVTLTREQKGEWKISELRLNR